VHQARLDIRDEHGVSLRKHYAAGLEQGVGDGRLLEGPPCPPELAHVLRWFDDLKHSRVTPFGLGALTYTEIDAWARRTGRDPDPVEVSALRGLDLATRATADEKPDAADCALAEWLSSHG
jgi:hypothetical protein